MRPETSSHVRSAISDTSDTTVKERDDASSSTAPASSSRGADSPLTSHRLRQDVLRLAYDRFLYDFVASEDFNRPPDEPLDALFSFVPLLYQHVKPGSCLTTIVNAAAYINSANRCSAPHAAILAEESFGEVLWKIPLKFTELKDSFGPLHEGIRLLARVIADTEKAASNDALCSVHLMGAFEILTDFQRWGTFAAHRHGANALLQLQTLERCYQNHISARLFEMAHAQMETAKFLSRPVEENFSDVFVTQLIWKEAQLHAWWHETKHSNILPTNRHALQDILQTALDLDAEYQAWDDTHSKYARIWQDLVLMSRGAPTEIHIYYNLKRCSLWIYHRTCRLFLLRYLLEITNWMSHLSNSEGDSSPRGHTNTTQSSPIPESGTGHSVYQLKNITLRSHGTSATEKMIEFKVIEQSCAIVLGSFTVQMYKMSAEDVMGMRDHIVFGSLVIIDSTLSSGIIPDSHNSPNTKTAASSSMRSSPPIRSGTESVGDSASSFYHDASMATVENGFTDSPTRLIYRHTVSPNMTDVAARREWLHSQLYFTATELGIKNALAVPVMEGYIPVSKPRVDEIIGR
ncbi:hypothetical protein BDU57DRAFT_584906 [Ampelomyces quisqualis]|uniref:Uncharacterized protein n=1 Tax=Ampelomyces quisqualis TaxID=50730 RepID=A0A6A5R7T6_AMPQU|nr:hypothetical protein BDU57DRAFT_584906 [Ampelomyces quisqualis]